MAKTEDQKEVFISYSTKNSELAQFLCCQLEGSGVACWIAPRDIPSGKSWANAIVEGITNIQVMVLLVSEASVASAEVEKEIDLANGMKKLIFPVRIENVMLKGACLYHLSNKQWIDALEEDKFVRFKSAVDVVLQSLDKKSFVQNVKTGSTSDLFSSLCNELNQKHRQRLQAINAMFNIASYDNNIVISLPLRIGATGVDLRFCYDIPVKEIRIYADTAFDGDPIKEPFVSFVNSHFQGLFGKIERISRARRYAFAELVPKTQLGTPLTSSSTQICFEHFKENMMIFSDSVLPKLFDWIEYSSNVISTINRLEEALEKVFPETEGWRVGAPEGGRLNGCLWEGKINVYKPEWQPHDNYRSRGLLSITLESSGPFIDNLKIGILKYEPWMTLRDWDGRLSSECNRLAVESGSRDERWVWWQSLGEQWSSSGIAQGDFRWNDKFDAFIEYCTEKFRKLKNLEGILAQACSELPSLQQLDINLEENIPKEQLRWWESSLYVYNWMEHISNATRQIIKNTFNRDDITVGFSYKGEWWTDIFLTFKVEKFDAAVRFRCGKNQMITEAFNLEPPDFETEIINDFINDKKVEFSLIKVETDFDGETFLKWLERFEKYVIEQTSIAVPALVALKDHLEKVVTLTKDVELELTKVLISEHKWVVDNQASSLERYDPINVWNKGWLHEAANKDERPPIVIQISPESACFDDLTLVVKHLDRPIPEVERNLGAICGACDYAFGSGIKNPSDDIWKKSFDDPYRIIGGRHFKDSPLVEGEQQSTLLSRIKEIAAKVKHMEPIITETCRVQNDFNFRSKLHGLVDDIVTELSREFSSGEGWECFENVKARKDPYAGISIYKKDWIKGKVYEDRRAVFSFRLECNNNYAFNDLYIGLAKGSDKLMFQEEIGQKLHKLMSDKLGDGKSSQWWIYWRYLDSAYRYSINYLQKKDVFTTHVKDLFIKLKELAPLVDEIVSSERFSIGA